MREKKKKVEIGTAGMEEGLSLSIGALLGKEVPPQSVEETRNPAKKTETAKERQKTLAELLAGLTQVTLHRESSGRGGRMVTLVRLKGNELPDAEELAKALRKGLGCGSHVGEECIVLQGNIADRAEEWFAKKGVKRIVLGN